MAPSQISTIKDYPTPTDRTTVRAMMGTFNYYRTFIPLFSKIAAPINNTLQIDQKFKWTKEAQDAMDQLKEKLCEEPILARPDYNRPFILQTDACKTGLGAVLCQRLPVINEEGYTLINKNGDIILKE